MRLREIEKAKNDRALGVCKRPRAVAAEPSEASEAERMRELTAEPQAKRAATYGPKKGTTKHVRVAEWDALHTENNRLKEECEALKAENQLLKKQRK